jgi:hypothetical protein
MKVYILSLKNNNEVMGVMTDVEILGLSISDDFYIEEFELDFDPKAKKFYMVVWPTRVNNDRYAYSIQPSTKEIFYLNTVRFNRYAYVLAYSEEEALKLGEKIFKENEL